MVITPKSRSSAALALTMVMLGSPVPATPGQAQQGAASLRAEGLAGSVQQTSPGYLDKQKAYIRSLRGLARSESDARRMDYVTALRTGLNAIDRTSEAGPNLRQLRSLTGPGTVSTKINLSSLDRDFHVRRNYDRLLRDAENGLRIVGGQRVREEDGFEHTVALRRYVNGSAGVVICTGVLIRRNVVLTAAHCVCDLRLDRTPGSGSRVLAITGNTAHGNLARALDTAYDIDTTRTQLLNKTFCSSYNATGRVVSGTDLAVLFLRSPVPDDFPVAEIAPLSLYLSPDTRALTIVGFGETGRLDVSRFDRPKMFAAVPIASKLCSRNESFRRFRNCFPGREMVLSDWFFRGKDTCGGDSGGPAYVQTAKTYFLAAITSRALDSRARCGPGGVYSVVTPRVVAWLERVLPRASKAVEFASGNNTQKTQGAGQ